MHSLLCLQFPHAIHTNRRVENDPLCDKEVLAFCGEASEGTRTEPSDPKITVLRYTRLSMALTSGPLREEMVEQVPSIKHLS